MAAAPSASAGIVVQWDGVSCRFCRFTFADAKVLGLVEIVCSEHEAPVCPNCFCCQAVDPSVPLLMARYEDAT